MANLPLLCPQEGTKLIVQTQKNSNLLWLFCLFIKQQVHKYRYFRRGRLSGTSAFILFFIQKVGVVPRGRKARVAWLMFEIGVILRFFCRKFAEMDSKGSFPLDDGLLGPGGLFENPADRRLSHNMNNRKRLRAISDRINRLRVRKYHVWAPACSF